MRKRRSRGRGIIVGRRCPKSQLCPRCGQMRVYHSLGTYHCPVPEEVLDALRWFRDENGPRWKSVLCQEWERACSGVSDMEERSLLQQARNAIGPSRLYKITL